MQKLFLLTPCSFKDSIEVRACKRDDRSRAGAFNPGEIGSLASGVLHLGIVHGPWSSSTRGSRGSVHLQRIAECPFGAATGGAGCRVAQGASGVRLVPFASAELEDRQMEVSGIPAPPWGEAERSEWLRARFEELSLDDVHRTSWAMYLRCGRERSQSTLHRAERAPRHGISGRDQRRPAQAGKLYGPGISDNGSGIVALLAIAGAMCATEIANGCAHPVYRQRGRRGRRRPARHAAHLSATAVVAVDCLAHSDRRRRHRHHHLRRLGQPPL